MFFHAFSASLIFVSAALSLPELGRQASPAIMRLEVNSASGEGIGTGFLISTEGWIVTNHHVVKDALAVVARPEESRRIPVLGLLAVDPVNDLAILKLDTGGGGFAAEPLSLGSTAGLRPGDEVAVVGYPLGLSETITGGNISAIEIGSEELRFTAPISRGSSGSPVMTMNGETVGVVTSYNAGGQNINYATKVEALHRLIQSIDTGARPKPFGGFGIATGSSGLSWVLNLGISLVFFAALFFVWKRLSRA